MRQQALYDEIDRREKLKEYAIAAFVTLLGIAGVAGGIMLMVAMKGV